MVAHKAVNDKLSDLSKISSIFNAITNTKKMFILVQIIDYRIANELSRRVSTLLKGLIRRKKNKTMQVSKKSGKHSNEKKFTSA